MGMMGRSVTAFAVVQNGISCGALRELNDRRIKTNEQV